VPIITAQGFDVATGRGARSERETRPARGERQITGARSERTERAPRSPREKSHERQIDEVPAAHSEITSKPRTETRVARERERGQGDSRRDERERAYALNPDQPLATKSGSGASPSRGSSTATPHGKSRPVPALLMKRRTKEPEQV
jgi:hypothetical protein